MKRRSFLRRTTATAAGLLIVPRHVLGGPDFAPPSDIYEARQLTEAARRYCLVTQMGNQYVKRAYRSEW